MIAGKPVAVDLRSVDNGHDAEGQTAKDRADDGPGQEIVGFHLLGLGRGGCRSGICRLGSRLGIENFHMIETIWD